MPRFNNPSSLESVRKNLRRNSTDSEKFLWSKVKQSQLGFKFRRQHGIGPYILDFYCPRKKLAIELDGSQHNSPEGRQYDQERTEYLNSIGIKILRFWNGEVSKNIKLVLEIIWRELNKPPLH